LLQWFVLFLQVVSTLLLIVLMAVQTDKAEQGGGGVMGLGAASGRTSGNINLPVGAERILKPLTAWAAFGFLASSILNAIPDNVLTIGHVLVVLVIYIIGMLFGSRIWAAITGAAGR
jgi:protein translocase SecG subunit